MATEASVNQNENTKSSTTVSSPDLFDLFFLYKIAGKRRVDLCEDNDSKLIALQKFVAELLEQNELLIETVHELQIVTRNRWEQLENRLMISAKATQETVLHLDKYEKMLKSIIAECMANAPDKDLVDELNNHIAALKVENSFLRDRNENLQHDLDNVLRIVKLGKGSDEGVGDCFTFCDSLAPEDVFGSIERVDEKVINNSDEACAIKLSANNGNGLNMEDSGLTTTDGMDSSKVFALEDKEVQVNLDLHSTANFAQVVEEKEYLIKQLQEHLQNLSKDAEMKDEVIKNLENKLFVKRKECEEMKKICDDLRSKKMENDRLKRELEERINTLNDQKRALMIQIDEQSDEYFKCREELKAYKKQATDLKRENELQSMTIQHLRDVITDQVHKLTSNISSSSMRNGSLHETEMSNYKPSHENV